MRPNNVMGMIFSNAFDGVLPQLTALRAMGSVPFAGRYRLIDFALSGLVNAGISHVGVVTRGNYRSLMDHLGTGKPWDLSRKNGGLFLLPPFNSSDSGGMYRNRLDALYGVSGFIRRSPQEYVLLCDGNLVANLDLESMLEQHSRSGADITVASCRGTSPALGNTLLLDSAADGRITDCGLVNEAKEDALYSANITLMKKSLLEQILDDAANRRQESFEQLAIAENLSLNVFHYPLSGFVRQIDSLQCYFDVSMELLEPQNRKALFPRSRPVYTKLRDEPPAIYGLGANADNALVADGCKIEGTVENSILFRGVTVGKGAVVRNSIVMQGSCVGEGASVEYVILDKDTHIAPQKTLCGAANVPLYVEKGKTV